MLVQAPSPEHVPLGVPVATHTQTGLTGGTGFGGSTHLVEVLHIPGCPNHQSLMARLPRIVEDSRVNAIVIERIIADEAGARAERFLGSPTVRIDGMDVDPHAAVRTGVGLSCRLYRTETGLQGSPPDQWIARALRQATGELRPP